MASLAHKVTGVEGSQSLLNWAKKNHEWNNIARSNKKANLLADIAFKEQNLLEISAESLRLYGSNSKWLIDPPREGAFALVQALTDSLNEDSSWLPPNRIVYISCNPATLARDAGVLVHSAGYCCTAVGMVNMFPHTAHVESIAIFDRP
jgi:23S rRNA (uracil1939-C5)-methyltransferase